MKLYHHKALTKEERDRLNGPNGGWDSEPRFTMYADITMGDMDAAETGYSEGYYEHVADIPGDDLEQVFSMTQNLGADGWVVEARHHKMVNPVGGIERRRSTSVGDIVELNGDFYLVAGVGFTRMPNLSK